MPVSTSIAKQRVPELDGLRGLAILSVLVFHYVAQEGAQAAGSYASYLQRFTILGSTGIDLFFVLSGFLIGGILMENSGSSSYFKTFYARRFFRIVPIYYLWITLYIGLIAVAGGFITRLSNSGIRPPIDFGIFSYFLFLQNVVPLTLFGLAGAWFGHLWSLAVEEQFYLVAPLAVRFVSQRALKWALAAVIACVPLFRIFILKVAHVPAGFVLGSVWSRADSLAIGVMCASLTRGEAPALLAATNRARLRVLLGILSLGVAALWRYAPQGVSFGMQSFGYTWMALFYAVVLLLAIGNAEGWMARAARTRWLRELGTVSYCVYIIHIVVNVVLHAVLLHKAPRISTARGALVTVLAVFVTFVLAKLSWWLVEAPLLRRGHNFKY